LNLFAYTSQKVQIRLKKYQLLRKIAGSSSKQDAMVLPLYYNDPKTLSR